VNLDNSYRHTICLGISYSRCVYLHIINVNMLLLVSKPFGVQLHLAKFITYNFSQQNSIHS
jgi:hypothetical protein